MQINKLINSKKKEFDTFFKKLLKNHLSNDLLSKAMIYASMNGGKRIRPFLVSIFSELSNIDTKKSLRISAAIELIHSYSLVHDDLPSMDNDDFRRGKPSTHKKFNEATAILTGDALHDLAFEILGNHKTHSSPAIRIFLINKLTKQIGLNGLAGGQSLDLLYENKKISISKILKMYEMKTASLFIFSCIAPYILASKSKNELRFAEEYGKIFGLIFQIVDDILDEEKDFISIGKTPGKDKKQGKSTLLSIKNKKKLKEYCLNMIKKFEKNNYNLLKKKPILKKLIYFNIDRLN